MFYSIIQKQKTNLSKISKPRSHIRSMCETLIIQIIKSLLIWTYLQDQKDSLIWN